MIKIFYSQKTKTSLSQVAEEIANDLDKVTLKHIVVTEERFTLACEKFLAETLGGFFSASVTSFGNLAKKAGLGKKYLSQTSQIMAISKVLEGADLTFFSRASKNPSFAEVIFSSISQLKSSRVSPADLEKAGLSSPKLRDFVKIFKGYEEFKGSVFVDAQDKMEALISSINENPFFENKVFHFVGFYDFTSQMLEVICKIAKKTTVNLHLFKSDKECFPKCDKDFLTAFDKLELGFETKVLQDDFSRCQREVLEKVYEKDKKSHGDIKAREFETEKEELEFVANEILKLVMRGKRFSDCAIISSNVGDDHFLESVLKKHEIPFFVDKKYPLKNFPLSELLFDVLNLEKRGFEKGDLRKIATNPFFGFERDEALEFENHILKFNISRNKFKNPKFFQDVFPLKEKFDALLDLTHEKIETGETFSKKVLEFSEKKMEFFEKSFKEDENLLDFVKVKDQFLRIFSEVLAEMSVILGSDFYEVSYLVEILKSGVFAKEISIIPLFSDCVFVGDFLESKMEEREALFVTGASLGNVPFSQKDLGLISDKDILALSKKGVDVSPSIEHVNEKERFNVLAALLSCTKHLNLSYSKIAKGEKNIPGELFKNFFFEKEEIEKEPEMQGLFEVKKVKSRGGLEELYAKSLSGEDRVSRLLAPSIYSGFLRGKEETLKDITGRKNVEFVEMNEMAVERSSSYFESFFSCPYKNFLSNHLKLSEREMGDLREFGSGNFVHKVIEIFTEKLTGDKNVENVEKVVSEICERVKGTDEFKIFAMQEKAEFIFSRLEKECTKVAKFLSEKKDKTDFRTVFREWSFGKSVKRPMTYGKVALKGVIDRIDTFENYLQVVDYKTGTVTKSLADLYYGSKIQHYLYLGVASTLLKKEPVGAFYFPISDDYTACGTSFTMKGDFVDDQKVLKGMDKEVQVGETSEIIPLRLKKGVWEGVKSASMVTYGEMEARLTYVQLLLEKGQKAASGGYVRSIPLKTNLGCACDYCKFPSICMRQDDQKMRMGNGNVKSFKEIVEGEKS